MTKRFGLVLVVLLALSMLLAACKSESRDVAEDYINALMTGDSEKALSLACDSFKDQTAFLLEAYAAQQIVKDSLDLKFDVGKAQNHREIIVTGSYNYGSPDNVKQYRLAEKSFTRLILWLQETDGEWCLTDESVFEGMGVGYDTGDTEPPVETEQPDAEPTEEVEQAGG